MLWWFCSISLETTETNTGNKNDLRDTLDVNSTKVVGFKKPAMLISSVSGGPLLLESVKESKYLLMTLT